MLESRGRELHSPVATFGLEGLIAFWSFTFSAIEQGARQMTKLSEYVKVAEAAEILGVSQGTVRSWAEAGKIPVHRNPANGYRLFRRGDLEEFLDLVGKRSVPTKPK